MICVGPWDDVLGNVQYIVQYIEQVGIMMEEFVVVFVAYIAFGVITGRLLKYVYVYIIPNVRPYYPLLDCTWVRTIKNPSNLL